MLAKTVMTEQALHDRLAIVEGTVDRNGADIGGAAGRDHAALHVGNSALRKQDDEVDLAAIAKGFDRRTAGIAGSGDDDGAPLAARGQRVIHEPREELHRQIFERECRTVEKFKHKRVDAELAERGHGGMAKIAIGFPGEPREIGRDRVVGKGPDDLDRNFGVGAAGEPRDCPGVEARPSVRHIEPAIAGKAGKHGIAKAERGCLASGRDILHWPFPPTAPARSANLLT